MKPAVCEISFSNLRNAYTAVFEHKGEKYFADFSAPKNIYTKTYISIYPIDENNHIVAELASYKSMAVSFGERTLRNLRNLIERFCTQLDEE